MSEKICPLCRNPIHPKDRWVHIEDYNAGKKEGEKDCHLNCWQNWHNIKVQKALKKAMDDLKYMIPGMVKMVKENI